MVITFDRHPRQVVQTDYVPRLITSLDEKLRLLPLRTLTVWRRSTSTLTWLPFRHAFSCRTCCTTVSV